MNWEAVGAIGEIVGAVGVIVTLGYLAVQVRQNSRQLERSVEASRVAADDSISRGFDRWRELSVTDNGTADLFLRGMEDIGNLGQADRLQFNYLLASFNWLAWQVWRAENLLGDTNADLLRHMLLHRGGRAWYLSHRGFIPPDFRSAVDKVLDELERHQVPFLRPEDPSSMFSGALREPPETETAPEG
jgi:hypothetical protein